MIQFFFFFFHLGKFELAEKNYLASISATENSLNDFNADNVTTIFNMGRLYEDQCMFNKAIEIYTKISEKFPKYEDGKKIFSFFIKNFFFFIIFNIKKN